MFTCHHCGKQLKSLGGMKYHVMADHNNQVTELLRIRTSYKRHSPCSSLVHAGRERGFSNVVAVQIDSIILPVRFDIGKTSRMLAEMLGIIERGH